MGGWNFSTHTQKQTKPNTNAFERIQARFPHMQIKKDPLHQSEAAIECLSSKSRIYVYNTKILMKGHSWNAPNSTNLIGHHIFNFKLWIKLTPSIPFQIACMCTNAVQGYFAVLQQLQARRHAAQRERMSRLQEQHEALKKMASYGMFCA